MFQQQLNAIVNAGPTRSTLGSFLRTSFTVHVCVAAAADPCPHVFSARPQVASETSRPKLASKSFPLTAARLQNGGSCWLSRGGWCFWWVFFWQFWL